MELLMLFKEFVRTPITESQESDVDLDRILVDLCGMVVQGKQRNPDYYGMVAAAVVDPDGRVVKAVNHRDDAGQTHTR